MLIRNLFLLFLHLPLLLPLGLHLPLHHLETGDVGDILYLAPPSDNHHDQDIDKVAPVNEESNGSNPETEDNEEDDNLSKVDNTAVGGERDGAVRVDR